MDIGFNVTGRLQGKRLSTDGSPARAAHDPLLACNHPRYLPLLTDDDLGRLNVTLNVAVDLQAAATNDLEPLANNLEVVAYDRLLPARRRADGALQTVGAVSTGRTRLRFGLGRRTTREHEIPRWFKLMEPRTNGIRRLGAPSQHSSIPSLRVPANSLVGCFCFDARVAMDALG